MNQKRCPYCRSVQEHNAERCHDCKLPINGNSIEYPDGELIVTKPWRTEVCLTFIRNENSDDGYGISKTYLKKEVTQFTVANFVRDARTLL
jgi:hypothetical protein